MSSDPHTCTMRYLHGWLSSDPHTCTTRYLHGWTCALARSLAFPSSPLPPSPPLSLYLSHTDTHTTYISHVYIHMYIYTPHIHITLTTTQHNTYTPVPHSQGALSRVGGTESEVCWNLTLKEKRGQEGSLGTWQTTDYPRTARRLDTWSLMRGHSWDSVVQHGSSSSPSSLPPPCPLSLGL